MLETSLRGKYNCLLRLTDPGHPAEPEPKKKGEERTKYRRGANTERAGGCTLRDGAREVHGRTSHKHTLGVLGTSLLMVHGHACLSQGSWGSCLARCVMQEFLTRVDLASSGSIRLEAFLVVTTREEGVPLVSSESRPGTLLRCTGQPLQRDSSGPNVSACGS